MPFSIYPPDTLRLSILSLSPDCPTHLQACSHFPHLLCSSLDFHTHLLTCIPLPHHTLTIYSSLLSLFLARLSKLLWTSCCCLWAITWTHTCSCLLVSGFAPCLPHDSVSLCTSSLINTSIELHSHLHLGHHLYLPLPHTRIQTLNKNTI